MNDSHEQAEALMREYLGPMDEWPAGMCNRLDRTLQQAELAAYERAGEFIDNLAHALKDDGLHSLANDIRALAAQEKPDGE